MSAIEKASADAAHETGAAAETARNERRRHRRSGVMLPALLDQVPVTITDLSLGGIGTGAIEMLFDESYGLQRGQRASLRFLQSNDFTDSVEVEIVRVSSSRGEIGARYVELTPDQRHLIETLSNGSAH